MPEEAGKVGQPDPEVTATEREGGPVRIAQMEGG